MLYSINGTNNKNSIFNNLFYKKKMKNNDLLIFIQSISEFFKLKNDMVFSLESSIHCLSNEFKFNVKNIIISIKKGLSFSESLEKNNIFPDYALRLIKIGEKNNNFNETFCLLKNLIEFNIKEKNNFFNAMLYPFFTLFAFFIVFFVFADYILPNILDIMQTFNSNNNCFFIVNFIFYFKCLFFSFIFAILSLFFVYKFYAQLFEKIIFHIPYLNKLLILHSIFILSYSIYISLKSGLKFIDVINLLIESESGIKKNIFIKIKEDLIKGQNIYSALKKLSFIDKIFLDIVKTGENAGNLENSFLIIKEISFQQYEKKINLFIKFFPIIIMLLTAFMLFLFVYLVFLPIYQMGFNL